MAALYVHLHLYLISLWDAIANAPNRIGPDSLFDRVYPGVIVQTAVLYRSHKRRDGSAPPHLFACAMGAITIFFVWFSTPALLGYLYCQSMALHSLLLTLWIGACLTVSCFFGFGGVWVARGRLSRPKREREKVHMPSRFLQLSVYVGFVFVAALLFALSAGATRDSLITYGEGDLLPRLVSADLREAELTPRPADWRPHPLWLEDFEALYRRREGLEMGEPLGERQAAFMTEAWQRYREYIASLDAPDLSNADLRGARLNGAFLPGADLSEAKMQEADLSWAQMQGANLRWAQMQEATLFMAQMQGANLSAAQMQGANLSAAQMRGANLSEAQMQGANLSNALMQGADLRGVQMQGTDISHAKIRGASLIGAQMQDSDCEGADFRATFVHSANLTCRNGTLTQKQLLFAVGDADTILPEGLYVLSCLERAKQPPEFLSEIEDALEYYPEESRRNRISGAQFEGLLFCDKGENREKFFGRPPDIGGGRVRPAGIG